MKVDLKKECKKYFFAKLNCTTENFGEHHYITASGSGEPNGEEFKSTVHKLYAVAYKLKNYLKKKGNDFVVPPLEGLWWVNSSTFFMDTPRSQWQWKILIMMPDFVTTKAFKEAIQQTRAKNKEVDLTNVKVEKINEEKCIQILHTGSYQQESNTIKMMDDYLKKNQLMRNGHHHEIYLSDPNKTAPAKMKTILRQPVK